MFKKGSGNVMPGFNHGTLGVRSGIPPKLAYGPTGKKPKIPSNTYLEIEVEVVKIMEGVIEKVSVLLFRQANGTQLVVLTGVFIFVPDLERAAKFCTSVSVFLPF